MFYKSGDGGLSTDIWYGFSGGLVVRSHHHIITNDYPPTYIWNCENDNSVPQCNCGLMKSDMDATGVKNAYEKFPGENHGFGFGTGTAADGWSLRAINFWLNSKVGG